MAGNACEWVTTPGTNHVAVGGHFESPAEELGSAGRYVETAAWNRDDPEFPKSIWWFRNAPWVGFRLAAEIPDGKN